MSSLIAMESDATLRVRDQYERWPYPKVPILASVPRESLWQLHLNWIRSRCGLAPLKSPSDIWIAGCGTFQPYLLARANPEARILASDLSLSSLQWAKKRLKWHGMKRVELAPIDLSQKEAFPEKKFDWIECYGVLMSVPDPVSTLRQLGERLKPDGILRIMIYPHYGRQRIFQIQRLASLLELNFKNPAHPLILKRLLNKLPKDHPLSYAFSSYWDAQNLPGIVDGFLHASDRGFTGFELAQLIESAELSPLFCFHRPWGQPEMMSKKLSSLGEQPFSFWLHYLDLWQSLRTNFTLCLTKKELKQNPTDWQAKHPLFDLNNPHLRFWDKAKLLTFSMTGTRLPSRTADESLRLTPHEMRSLMRGRCDSEKVDHVLLSSRHFSKTNLSHDLKTAKQWNQHFLPRKHFTLRTGKLRINPLYDYLWDAYTFKEQLDSIGDLATRLPSLSDQIGIWGSEAFPLEGDKIRFGLTPFGTYSLFGKEIEASKEIFLTAKETSFAEVEIPNEKRALNEVLSFLNSFDYLKEVRKKIESEKDISVLRQLWVLLFSHQQLFLTP